MATNTPDAALGVTLQVAERATPGVSAVGRGSWNGVVGQPPTKLAPRTTSGNLTEWRSSKQLIVVYPHRSQCAFQSPYLAREIEPPPRTLNLNSREVYKLHRKHRLTHCVNDLDIALYSCDELFCCWHAWPSAYRHS